MKLLLHTCCAPCSIMCIENLKEYDITCYFYNPNIHPYMEYKARKEALEEYLKTINIPLVVNDNYGLRMFVREIYPDLEDRCGKCYRMRLEETVKYAKENGYDSFSTTLLISPYQKHELIIKVCEELSKEYGIEFVYKDFRPYFREGQNKARELGIYRQKYCGCVFSEEERYLGNK